MSEESTKSTPQGKAVKVTYRPVDHSDPAMTTCYGMEWQANVPKMLDPKKHFVLLPRTRLVMVGAIAQAHEYEEEIPIIELAKGNPWFEVEGFPRQKRIIPTKKVPPAGAEWEGTNRADLVPASEFREPIGFSKEDEDESIGGVVMDRSGQVTEIL